MATGAFTPIGSSAGGGSGGSVPVPVFPTPGFLNIESDFTQAYNVTNFAVAHAAAADDFLNKLGNLAASLAPPVINPVFPVNLNAPTIVTPLPPDLYPIDFSAPLPPQPFTGSLNVDVSFPDFDTSPPALLFPNAPTQQLGGLPTSPAIDLNFAYPTIDVSFPDAPDLLSVNVTRFDGVTFPTFDEKSPVLNLVAPQVVNYVPNAPYTDALLDGLVGTLRQRLEIGVTGSNTGLPAAVEENIWNRGREREIRAKGEAIRNLDKMAEVMGYMLPPGVMVDNRIKIETELGALYMGASREIMIKQAELEQSNLQKAMELAAQIEGKLIDYANQTEQRRFDACKYATEAGVSVYNAAVQAYAARVQGYRAAVDVYTAQIAGARAIIEAYTAQIAAEKLKVDANQAIIQEYKTRIDAATASIEVFKAEIAIVQTRAQIEQTKVSIYGEQVKAYAQTVSVFSAEVEAYRAQLSAEQTKEGIYSTQAQVYGSLVDARAKAINAQIEAYRAELQEKQQEYTAFSTLVSSEAERVKAIAAANSAVADIYKSEVQGTSSYNDAMVKEWEAVNTISTQIAQIGVSAGQANGQLYLATRGIATDAAKVGAQVEAQIAASALGTVTWATHRSRQDSMSASQSRSDSTQSSKGENTNTTYYNDQLPHYNNNFQQSSSSVSETVHNIQSVE